MTAKQRSVDALERVYTFVIGLALVQGITHLVDLFNLQNSSGSTGSEGLAPYGMGLVMLVTLVPFYHGANRHIDETYLFADPGLHAKPVALVIDVGVLVIEGILFVFMGASVRQPEQFMAAYLMLLTFPIRGRE